MACAVAPLFAHTRFSRALTGSWRRFYSEHRQQEALNAPRGVQLAFLAFEWVRAATPFLRRPGKLMEVRWFTVNQCGRRVLNSIILLKAAPSLMVSKRRAVTARHGVRVSQPSVSTVGSSIFQIVFGNCSFSYVEWPCDQSDASHR